MAVVLGVLTLTSDFTLLTSGCVFQQRLALDRVVDVARGQHVVRIDAHGEIVDVIDV